MFSFVFHSFDVPKKSTVSIHISVMPSIQNRNNNINLNRKLIRSNDDGEKRRKIQMNKELIFSLLYIETSNQNNGSVESASSWKHCATFNPERKLFK